MARIIYSALITEIAGSVGGTTFQRNAYGFTIKNKPNMVKPVTRGQVLRKIAFQSIVQAWRELSQANRDAWILYSSNYPIASRLNPDSNLNGFNYFSRYHLYKSLTSSDILADPGGAPVSISGISSQLTVTGGTVLNIVLDATPAGGDWGWLLYLTRPQGVGQKFVQNAPIALFSQDDDFPYNENITGNYNLLLGSIPEVGDYVGQKIVFVRTDAAQVLVIPVQRVQVVAA